MKHDRCKVFFPAIATMAGLHLMSVAFGTLFPLLFSRNAIVYFSIILFIVFGVMMLYEAYYVEVKKSEDKVKELEDTLLNKPESPQDTISTSAAIVASNPEHQKKDAGTQLFCANPYLHLVVLLFLADWGDRCQISAIVLTATHNVWGVAAGGAIVTQAGHG
jgi:putative Ca2+/H+ antiporter (TMEM165/GDT1 family)